MRKPQKVETKTELVSLIGAGVAVYLVDQHWSSDQSTLVRVLIGGTTFLVAAHLMSLLLEDTDWV